MSAGNAGTDLNLAARSITITVPGTQAIPDVRFAPLDDEPLPAPRAHPDPSAPSGSGIDPVVDVLTAPHADCTEQVVNLTNPVRVRVFHSAAGANPAALCVGLASADTGVRIGTDGDPGAPAPIVEPD